jgi:hypothetical protein
MLGFTKLKAHFLFLFNILDCKLIALLKWRLIFEAFLTFFSCAIFFGVKMESLSPIIVGNGLLANAFYNVRFHRKVVVFASGVSRSSEIRNVEFLRERELLTCVLYKNPDADFIYFSSTSVLSDETTAYARHKIQMEKLVAELSNNFYIFRLPQVVGVVLNNTLVSHLVRSCMECGRVKVHKNAVRNIIGVDDVARIVKYLVDARLGLCSAQTLASASNILVPHLMDEVVQLLGTSCNLDLIDRGDDQTVNVDFLRENLGNDDPVLADDYWKCVLRNYVPPLKARILNEQKDSH